MKRSFQVSFKIKEGKVEDFIKASLENKSNSTKEKGNLRFDLLQDLKDEHSFVLYELYDNEESMEAHMQTNHFKKWFESTREFIEEQSMKYWKYLE